MTDFDKLDYGTNVLQGLLTRYNRMSDEEYERIFKNAKDYKPKKTMVTTLKKK